MEIPKLFVIAGPNGVGKSLFSKMLIAKNIDVFDGDRQMTSLRQEFPEVGSEVLWSHINNNVFTAHKKSAISLREDFAYETNFSSDYPISSAIEFQTAGYEIHLLFVGIQRLEHSIERVAYRVQKGGHKVSEDSIRFNFEQGFKNMYMYFETFDSVALFDNPLTEEDSSVIPQQILYLMNGELFLPSLDYPAWVGAVVALAGKTNYWVD